MFGSRTIKTLTALLISMTLGALALMVLETAPARPTPQHLAAVASPNELAGKIVHDTAVPFQRMKWRNVIVHSSVNQTPGFAQRCHFLIQPNGKIQVTALWKRQLSGNHVYVPGRDFNADSVGICLAGDFSMQAPPRAQMNSLIELVRTLQPLSAIPADRVYLHSDLIPYSQSPGVAFPSRTFNANLYRTRR